MQARLKALIEKELHGTQAKADSKSAARDWFASKDAATSESKPAATATGDSKPAATSDGDLGDGTWTAEAIEEEPVPPVVPPPENGMVKAVRHFVNYKEKIPRTIFDLALAAGMPDDLVETVRKSGLVEGFRAESPPPPAAAVAEQARSDAHGRQSPPPPATAVAEQARSDARARQSNEAHAETEQGRLERSANRAEQHAVQREFPTVEYDHAAAIAMEVDEPNGPEPTVAAAVPAPPAPAGPPAPPAQEAGPRRTARQTGRR